MMYVHMNEINIPTVLELIRRANRNLSNGFWEDQPISSYLCH